MKHKINLFGVILLNLLLILTKQNNVSAQSFAIDTILYNGNSSKFINIVFMGDGYQSGQLSTYTTNVLSTANYLFSTSPFAEYKNYFNVFAIKIPSTDAGTDHPGNATDVTEPVFPVVNVNTYFNSTFDYGLIHRLLVAQNFSTINSVLINNFPLYDQPLMLVNSPNYGGSGGSTAIASLDINSFEIMVHELGHSIAGLADEYYAGDIYAAEKPNMTQQTNPLLVKWKNWMGYGGVGIYQHCCGGSSALWYRPHNGCKMRYLGTSYPFCPVCKETIIEKIHQLFGTPVISSLPAQASVAYCTQALQFSLTLTKPIPNTLKVKWILNGSNIASNTASTTIVSGQLNIGANSLSAQILDTTALTRDNSHPTIHTYTVNWTINYNPLSQPTITAGGSTTLCQGGNVTLMASPANSYSWSNGATTQSIVVSAAGNYSVAVTNVNGCSATSSLTTITVNASPATPTISTNGAITFCQGGNVTLTAGSANSYSWSNGATTQSIVVSTSGNYSVTVTNTNGCTSTSSPQPVTVNSNPATPTIIPNRSTTICKGENVTLTTGSANSYSWSNGAATQSIIVSVAGNYSVIVTNVNGCSSNSAQETVIVNSVDTSLTFNNSILTSNASSASYQWVTCPTMETIDGETNQTFSPSQNGNYAVIVTQNGCTDTSGCYSILTTGLSFIDNSTSIAVFPNPANEILTIKGIGLTGNECQMTITNELGQILTKKSFSIKNGSIENQINIREFSNGIYFLRVNSKTVNHVFKIQKQ